MRLTRKSAVAPTNWKFAIPRRVGQMLEDQPAAATNVLSLGPFKLRLEVEKLSDY
jgi:hypothetical protein